MNINFEHHEGSQATRPQEIDTTSSNTVVYIRKNIEQIEREDEMSGETVTLWSYDEATISYDDYALYQNDDIISKLDYLEMLLDE